MGHAHQSTEGHQGLHRAAKGQLIWKGLFGVLDSSQKQTPYLSVLDF